jgi:hypothetical protein
MLPPSYASWNVGHYNETFRKRPWKSALREGNVPGLSGKGYGRKRFESDPGIEYIMLFEERVQSARSPL